MLSYKKLKEEFWENDEKLLRELIEKIRKTDDITSSTSPTLTELIEALENKVSPDIRSTLQHPSKHIKSRDDAIEWIEERFFHNSMTDTVSAITKNATKYMIENGKHITIGIVSLALFIGLVFGISEWYQWKISDNLNTPENIEIEKKEKETKGYFPLSPDENRILHTLKTTLPKRLVLEDESKSLTIEFSYGDIYFTVQEYREGSPRFSNHIKETEYVLCLDYSKIYDNPTVFYTIKLSVDKQPTIKLTSPTDSKKTLTMLIQTAHDVVEYVNNGTEDTTREATLKSILGNFGKTTSHTTPVE